MDNSIIISLCNGEKILLTTDENNTRGKRLGYFCPSKNEIDFPVHKDWVRNSEGWFFDYTPNAKYWLVHENYSFLSLLQSEAAKKWPLAKNPFNGLTSGDEYFNWTIAQSQVLPSKLLVIKIEK